MPFATGVAAGADGVIDVALGVVVCVWAPVEVVGLAAATVGVCVPVSLPDAAPLGAVVIVLVSGAGAVVVAGGLGVSVTAVAVLTELGAKLTEAEPSLLVTVPPDAVVITVVAGGPRASALPLLVPVDVAFVLAGVGVGPLALLEVVSVGVALTVLALAVPELEAALVAAGLGSVEASAAGAFVDVAMALVSVEGAVVGAGSDTGGASLLAAVVGGAGTFAAVTVTTGCAGAGAVGEAAGAAGVTVEGAAGCGCAPEVELEPLLAEILVGGGACGPGAPPPEVDCGACPPVGVPAPAEELTAAAVSAGLVLSLLPCAVCALALAVPGEGATAGGGVESARLPDCVPTDEPSCPLPSVAAVALARSFDVVAPVSVGVAGAGWTASTDAAGPPIVLVTGVAAVCGRFAVGATAVVEYRLVTTGRRMRRRC